MLTPECLKNLIGKFCNTIINLGVDKLDKIDYTSNGYYYYI